MSDDVPKINLDALEALLARASDPPPWAAVHYHNSESVLVAEGVDLGDASDALGEIDTRANADLVVGAVNALPALLAAHRAALARIAALHVQCADSERVEAVATGRANAAARDADAARTDADLMREERDAARAELATWRKHAEEVFVAAYGTSLAAEQTRAERDAARAELAALRGSVDALRAERDSLATSYQDAEARHAALRDAAREVMLHCELDDDDEGWTRVPDDVMGEFEDAMAKKDAGVATIRARMETAVRYWPGARTEWWHAALTALFAALDAREAELQRLRELEALVRAQREAWLELKDENARIGGDVGWGLRRAELVDRVCSIGKQIDAALVAGKQDWLGMDRLMAVVEAARKLVETDPLDALEFAEAALKTEDALRVLDAAVSAKDER